MPSSMMGRTAGILFILGVIVLPGSWGPSDLQLRPGTPGLVIGGGDTYRGQLLYGKLDCIQCHSEPRMAGGTNVPTNLKLSGSRSPASWLAQYVRDPEPLRFISEDTRPRLRMPGFSLSQSEARDLAAFLAMQTNPNLIPLRPDIISQLTDPETIGTGKSLFGEYQCLGCHKLGGKGNQIGPPLDRVGVRRKPEYIAALLEDPDRLIPGTAMKNHDLWADEIAALTAYLMTLVGP